LAQELEQVGLEDSILGHLHPLATVITPVAFPSMAMERNHKVQAVVMLPVNHFHASRNHTEAALDCQAEQSGCPAIL
jgi:hypothetical protein